MARLAILRFENDGTSNGMCTTINGAGAGFLLIWKILHELYEIPGCSSLALLDCYKDLFDKFNARVMSRRDEVLMASTCDHTYIPRAEMIEVAAAWQGFFDAEVKGKYRETIGHAADVMAKYLADPSVGGMAMFNTNTDNPWWIHDEQGDEGRGYDINRDSGHRTIYESFPPRSFTTEIEP